MKIGLLSDTHSFLDPMIFEYFKNCDEIWHAGDIGDPEIIHLIEKVKPLKAVFGNIDNKELQNSLPEDLWFPCEGLRIWMTHIGGAPPNYNPRVKKILKEKVPDVFICGHSHILRVKKDPAYKDMLYINPGAAGNHGFHTIKTIIRFEIKKDSIINMEAIELGKRGAL
ncbi:MAG: metallophosphoesterase family protein [Cytophagales bacterium]|nr:metallophosphoesterase family protein [Cytophagales bacterium]MCA6368632.1 metallophosphoesterase family protein [Cytophagales bacterium]MCA6370206.1 metallophosphoesterase family protein [Cytophagales bacterium]MCA6374655.1 metallophosphoesterase family protein [Cytophagales bacterium]MCA6385126.1 metallophosphoesterase family protein [Cytophagales bacterium]